MEREENHRQGELEKVKQTKEASHGRIEHTQALISELKKQTVRQEKDNENLRVQRDKLAQQWEIADREEGRVQSEVSILAEAMEMMK